MRLRSDIWVAAYLRRANAAGAFAVQRRRGAPEAGAIFIRIDHPDRRGALFGPAPQSFHDAGGTDAGRRFVRLHDSDWIEPAAIEARLAKEIRFDPDLWIIEVEDREGRTFLDDALS
jgi:hypothetical protein